MQYTFARATHSAYAAVGQARRATIGYLVYTIQPLKLQYDCYEVDQSISNFNDFSILSHYFRSIQCFLISVKLLKMLPWSF